METDIIRVLIVADDPLARAGLATLLADRPGLALVGQVAGQTAEDDTLLDHLDVYRPDVILWDLGWDGEELEIDFADLPVPVLVLLPQAALAAGARAAGAQGLLLRDGDGDLLQTSLEALVQGLLVLEPALADHLYPAGRAEGLPQPAEPLTLREEEVLALLAEGLSNRAIGQALDISEHTVKFHVNAIMTKLDAQSRTEAVVRATRLGLILL